MTWSSLPPVEEREQLPVDDVGSLLVRQVPAPRDRHAAHGVGHAAPHVRHVELLPESGSRSARRHPARPAPRPPIRRGSRRWRPGPRPAGSTPGCRRRSRRRSASAGRSSTARRSAAARSPRARRSRHEHDSADADFRARHRDCRSHRWSMSGSRTAHCGICCPPPPLSQQQIEKIRTIFQYAGTPDPHPTQPTSTPGDSPSPVRAAGLEVTGDEHGVLEWLAGWETNTAAVPRVAASSARTRTRSEHERRDTIVVAHRPWHHRRPRAQRMPHPCGRTPGCASTDPAMGRVRLADAGSGGQTIRRFRGLISVRAY